MWMVACNMYAGCPLGIQRQHLHVQISFPKWILQQAMLFHSRMHPPRDVQTIWSFWMGADMVKWEGWWLYSVILSTTHLPTSCLTSSLSKHPHTCNQINGKSINNSSEDFSWFIELQFPVFGKLLLPCQYQREKNSLTTWEVAAGHILVTHKSSFSLSLSPPFKKTMTMKNSNSSPSSISHNGKYQKDCCACLEV